jgi:hypothetical protein
MRDLSHMVSNDQLFQLFVLLTLLDTDGLHDVGPFTGTHKKF